MRKRYCKIKYCENGFGANDNVSFFRLVIHEYIFLTKFAGSVCEAHNFT